MEARGRDTIFLKAEKKSCQSRTLYPWKITFRNEEEIRTFSNEEEVIEFGSFRLTLRKRLKYILCTEKKR